MIIRDGNGTYSLSFFIYLYLIHYPSGKKFRYLYPIHRVLGIQIDIYFMTIIYYSIKNK